MKENGAEKLFSKMIDREYAEMADLPEDLIYEDDFDSDQIVDEKKDEVYYQNRIAKGYGLTDNPQKYIKDLKKGSLASSLLRQKEK